MVRARSLPLFVGLLMFVGGCVTPADDDVQGSKVETALPDWAVRALPNGGDHDHYDRAHHVGLTTPNFQVVGWDPLASDEHGMNAGGYFCGDVMEQGGRALSVVESFTSNVAFVIMDLTDPAKPTKLGELVMEQTQIWDIAMTPDQRFVLLATSPLGNIDEEESPISTFAAPKMWFRDACTGTVKEVRGPEAMLPYHSGVVLVDITDPTAPAVSDYRPLPYLGGHSVMAAEFGGETLALVTVTNTPSFTNYYAFYGIIDTPAGGVLETHSVYQTDTMDMAQTSAFDANHDGYLLEHPLTGERLAFLADGNWGVTILNVDDPTSPQVTGRWDEAEGIANPGWNHFAHSILPLDTTWDGRHYTFVSEECGARMEETPTCLVYTLDTTDPADPFLVGAWTLPHDVEEWTYPEFSPHYMAVIGRTLFVAHWHAGVWALDVSTPDALVKMPAIGVFDPEQDPGFFESLGYGSQYNMSPIIADIEKVGDHVVVYDGTSGVYVVSFDAFQPAPTPEPWPLNVG